MTVNAAAAPLSFPVRDAQGKTIAVVAFVFHADGAGFSRSDFINSFSVSASTLVGLRLMHAAKEGDWLTLHRFHPEALPWYCPHCECNYAEAQWSISPQFDEDGWMDSYRGRCPEGHERMIAD